MLTLLATIVITVGIAQIISSYRGWRAASLTGPHRKWGIAVGGLLTLLGGWGIEGQGLAQVWPVFGGLLLAAPLALLILLLAGSYLWPPEHPDHFFSPDHAGHGGCTRLDIADGPHQIPAYLLRPLPPKQTQAAVCILHGSGDNKRGFKWRLARALLAEGLTVLTIDLPGHGDYLHHPLAYPDALSTVPAAVCFLRQQDGVDRVGLLGISLGGAIGLKALVWPDRADFSVDALALLELPLWVRYNRQLVYREAWRALNAPLMSLFQEMSLRQLRQSWQEGAIRSRHSTDEMFQFLDPSGSMQQLPPRLPTLLVYSRHDPIAPLSFGQALQQAAPHAELLAVEGASHVTLTLMPQVNQQVARWLRAALS